jgi:hypothetical protein
MLILVLILFFLSLIMTYLSCRFEKLGKFIDSINFLHRKRISPPKFPTIKHKVY